MGRTYRGQEKEYLKKKYNEFRKIRKSKRVKEEDKPKKDQRRVVEESDDYVVNTNWDSVEGDDDRPY